MLFTEFHRDRQNVIQRTLEVAADAEAPLTTRDQQSTAEVFDPLSQPFHLQPPEVRGRDILDNRCSVFIERILRQRMRLARRDIDRQPRRLQRPHEIVFLPVRVQHQHARSRFNTHNSRTAIVLFERIVFEQQLRRVICDPAFFEQIAKQHTVQPRDEVSLKLRDLAPVAQHTHGSVSLAAGLHPDRELKRLARRDRVRQADRFNREVADPIPLEPPKVHRHAQLTSTPRRRHR